MNQELFEKTLRQLIASGVSPQKAMQLAAVEAGLPFDDILRHASQQETTPQGDTKE